MPTVLVTSANRGIGREFVRQYAQAGWRVIAACRSPELEADALRAMGNVRPIAMDVTDLVSVEAAARESVDPLHLLINSAGIIGQTGDSPGEVDYREWSRVLDVNLMGPVRVLDSFAERLAASGSAKAVAITSGMGSLADVQSPMAMMYRTSKAGLNMAMRVRALQLRPRGDGRGHQPGLGADRHGRSGGEDLCRGQRGGDAHGDRGVERGPGRVVPELAGGRPALVGRRRFRPARP